MSAKGGVAAVEVGVPFGVHSRLAVVGRRIPTF